MAVAPCAAGPAETTCSGSPSTSVSLASTLTTIATSSSVSASSSTASGGSLIGVTVTRTVAVDVSPPRSAAV